VLLAAVLIHADHAALEHAEVAFNRVGVDGAANVFVGTVIDDLVTGKIFAHMAILTGIIRHQ
jgi:hypothetical protein